MLVVATTEQSVVAPNAVVLAPTVVAIYVVLVNVVLLTLAAHIITCVVGMDGE